MRNQNETTILEELAVIGLLLLLLIFIVHFGGRYIIHECEKSCEKIGFSKTEDVNLCIHRCIFRDD